MAATQAQASACPKERLGKATILGMIAMGVAVLVVANDFTALSVALPAGIHIAFLVDGILALCGAAVALLFVGGEVDLERLRMLRHHHRAHA